MTEEIKYNKDEKWIPYNELGETPQQTIDRLKQENENAKTTVEECHKYMAKLEDENELKRIQNEELYADLAISNKKLSEYKKALEEIRDALGYGYIVNKINECLNKLS